MSSQFPVVQPILAQTPASPRETPGEATAVGNAWMFGTIGLAVALVAAIVYGKRKLQQVEKALKFEQFKSESLNRRLKLALDTIKKMETNPDLVHSREFNLDYLRMRMDETVFRCVILNQMKVCIRQLVSVALRPNTAEETSVGIANTSGRDVDRVFDIVYETQNNGKRSKGVLFRFRVKLTKLPTRSTSATVEEMIECIERFLSPKEEDYLDWQPTLQGQVVTMRWDQKAKPTPLLIFEQSKQGSNFKSESATKKRADLSSATRR